MCPIEECESRDQRQVMLFEEEERFQWEILNGTEKVPRYLCRGLGSQGRWAGGTNRRGRCEKT